MNYWTTIDRLIEAKSSSIGINNLYKAGFSRSDRIGIDKIVCHTWLDFALIAIRTLEGHDVNGQAKLFIDKCAEIFIATETPNLGKCKKKCNIKAHPNHDKVLVAMKNDNQAIACRDTANRIANCLARDICTCNLSTDQYMDKYFKLKITIESWQKNILLECFGG